MFMANSNFNLIGVVMPILFETFFFGAYSALLVFSTILLGSPSRTRHAMLAISMVMYSVSAAHWALVITTQQDWWYFQVSRGFRVGSDIAVLYLPMINYILSDGVVLWRAWVLWDRRLLLFIPPLISLVCTLATTVTSAVYYYKFQNQLESLQFSNNILPLIKDQNLSMHLEWSIWFLTFGTNLWATGLIFIRAWQHRRFLRLLYVKETLTRNTEKALAFLVESGALYLLIWVVYISTSITLDGDGTYFFHTAISQVVGMYPTIIVIVVAMRLSTEDILSRPGAEAHSTMVFNITPPNPLPRTAEDVEGSRDGSIAMKA